MLTGAKIPDFSSEKMASFQQNTERRWKNSRLFYKQRMTGLEPEAQPPIKPESPTKDEPTHIIQTCKQLAPGIASGASIQDICNCAHCHNPITGVSIEELMEMFAKKRERKLARRMKLEEEEKRKAEQEAKARAEAGDKATAKTEEKVFEEMTEEKLEDAGPISAEPEEEVAAPVVKVVEATSDRTKEGQTLENQKKEPTLAEDVFFPKKEEDALPTKPEQQPALDILSAMKEEEPLAAQIEVKQVLHNTKKEQIVGEAEEEVSCAERVGELIDDLKVTAALEEEKGPPMTEKDVLLKAEEVLPTAEQVKPCLDAEHLTVEPEPKKTGCFRGLRRRIGKFFRRFRNLRSRR